MERVVWVEVLGRHGVEHRVRVDRLPVTIGRGYGNDVIVDDAHADPVHARLSQAEDGSLLLEDLGTVNGTWPGGAAEPLRGAGVTIEPGRRIRIGRSQLRIATSDLPVPPAAPDTAPLGARAELRERRLVVLLPVLGLALMLFSGWLGDSQDDPASLASMGIGVLLLTAAWAGAWALGGRLATRHARFGAHHAAAWAFVIAVTISGVLFSWADFLTESRALAVLGVAVGTALFVLLLEAHFRFASAMPAGRRLAMSVAVTAGLGVLGWLLVKAETEMSGRELAIEATLKPVPTSMIPATDIASFLASTNDLKEKIDADGAGDATPESRPSP
jgi:hypothetical protein